MRFPGAVVTGAGRGIGAMVAERIASRGGRVVLAARTEREINATAARIVAMYGAGSACAVACDVARVADVERLRERAHDFLGKPVDLLVNNAGIVRRVAVHEMDPEAWDEVLNVNLKGAFLCTRAFLPGMLAEGRGRIVNVASISGVTGTSALSAYCASKWGLIGFTKAVAEETRGRGVQVMAILPGSVDTAMLRDSGYLPQMSADEVAHSIEWLGLDAPAAMTASAVEMFG